MYASKLDYHFGYSTCLANYFYLTNIEHLTYINTAEKKAMNGAKKKERFNNTAIKTNKPASKSKFS